MLWRMFEIFFLALIILLVPISRGSVFLLVLAVIVIIPGMYATWYGAPFVPTPRRLVRRMLALANIKPGETVYDLGCGDGRLVFAAAKLGANAIGYEFSVPTFLFAKLRSLFSPRTTIQMRDFWKQDYRDADVIFCYLLTETMVTFKTIVWPQLKPGCRVVSHTFSMKDITPIYKEEGVVVYEKE